MSDQVIPCIFNHAAEHQFNEAYAWYQSIGQEREFMDEFDALLGRLQSFPHIYQVVHKNVRRALLRRFPYAVFYVVEDTQLVILGVIHQSSAPERWPS